jgi:hypothetical protein
MPDEEMLETSVPKITFRPSRARSVGAERGFGSDEFRKRAIASVAV